MGASKTQYWLMKSEPDVYGIDHLQSEGWTHWEGVRNYQARNFMRDDMRVGDKVLFYHSNAKPPGVAGLAEVSKEAYPDFFAWDPDSNYFDKKTDPKKPIWMMVDLKYVEKFDRVVSLDEIKQIPECEDMLVIKKGQRLSVQPCEKRHYDAICKAARATA